MSDGNIPFEHLPHGRGRAMIADILIIKRTELANVVIVTGKKTNPNLIRYFVTFSVSPNSRYALRLADFVTEAAALHRHEQLLKISNRRGTP